MPNLPFEGEFTADPGLVKNLRYSIEMSEHYKDASGNHVRVNLKDHNTIADVFHNIGKYFLHLLRAILGYEGFTGPDNSGNPVSMVAGLGFVIFLAFLFTLLTAFGAAYQSYCYNMYVGNTSGVAVVYSILCFFFPQLYYPYYAIFLNPVCSMKPKNNKGLMGFLSGGRR